MNGAVQLYLEGSSARDIAASIEDSLRRGEIAPGDRLPPVRHLAMRLKVSPSTVASAYGELRRRGMTTAAGRGGTRVRSAPPLSRRIPVVTPPGARNLLEGSPDPAFLPDLPLVRRPKRLYGQAAVSPRLRELAARALAADGVEPGHIAVTGGALDGVERVLAAWLRPGDRVVLEDPGYTAVIDLVAAMGLETVAVPVDDRGLLPELLGAALERGAQAVVATPRAQNPTGAAWDDQRAAELAEALRRHDDGVLWIEDDHAGPVAGVPCQSIAGSTGKWATIRSVSKWLGPDLRLAIMAGDKTTVARVEGRQALGAGWVSFLLQETVADLWSDPATDALLRTAATTYSDRRLALAESLRAHAIASTGCSGLTTWVGVDDEHGVAAGLLASGWAVTPGERFRIASPPGLRIAFGSLLPEECPHLAEDLARLLQRSSSRLD
jgi:DNA-binding transcriptional MocR family regulator